MSAPTSLRWLIGLALVVAMPSIGCFCWYSAEAAGPGGGAWRWLLSLAYPLAMLAAAGALLAWWAPGPLSSRPGLAQILAKGLAALAVALALLIWLGRHGQL